LSISQAGNLRAKKKDDPHPKEVFNSKSSKSLAITLIEEAT